MSRKLKFRAWHKKRGILADVLSLLSNGRVEVSICDSGPFLWRVAESIEVMQYTGLKDRRGVDIFEGDVFNCKRDKAHPDGGYIAGTSDYHPESAEIVIFEDGCFLAGNDYLHNRLFWYERHHWDLIGNIYENPELTTTP